MVIQICPLICSYWSDEEEGAGRDFFSPKSSLTNGNPDMSADLFLLVRWRRRCWTKCLQPSPLTNGNSDMSADLFLLVRWRRRCWTRFRQPSPLTNGNSDMSADLFLLVRWRRRCWTKSSVRKSTILEFDQLEITEQVMVDLHQQCF
jgi:hypothetical protein